MKLNLILRREGTNSCRLVPADPFSEEKIGELPLDKDIVTDVSLNRKVGQNNAYWAGLAYAVHHIEAIERQWPTAKSLHKSLLIRLGYYTEVPFIQIKRRTITDDMLNAGLYAAFQLIRGKGVDAAAHIDKAMLRAAYDAMQAAAPDYGLHIVEDSTRFEAMSPADFTIYFDRAKLVILEMTGRDPWREWGEERSMLDGRRGAHT